jgi:hypothetical protein
MIRSTLAPKVRRQDLDSGWVLECSNPLDTRDEPGRAPVRQVIAIDGGDDHVFETHRPDRLGQLSRLVRVERPRTAVGDRTVGAVSCADAAVDQEGRCSAAEAFAAIRAARLLAHGVETTAAHPLLDVVQITEPHLAAADPFGEDRR